ncbi:MAG: peptide chain release factor N(5)-glutamine methyltransferase [Bacteroidales bacterium]|nr:peptide chain release factor N(5)-glutamine methyltransferase [Bacteroidales bacterium]MDD4217695.1 peptide chain release factor N(5)-glutamine methyltransferase [Bacteroidales bacterium]
MITLQKFNSQLIKSLEKLYSKDEATSIAEFYICETLNFSRTNLLLVKNEMLSENNYLKLIKNQIRLEQGEPVQYVTNTAWFYGSKFFVDKNVLIPRQETELLVDIIIKESKNKSIKILDIGTGSGCIPICLKKELENSQVFALDISIKALSIAQKNAELNNVNIEFINFDILSENQIPINKKFDVIISNPPYITNSEKQFMHANVLEFEPELALFVTDENPFVFYQAIINKAKELLKPTGVLWLEINEKFPNEIVKLCQDVGFVTNNIIKDINKKTRFVKSSFKNLYIC